MNANEFVQLLDMTYGEVLSSEVVRTAGRTDLQITEHTADMEYPKQGFSIAFKKAEWTARRTEAREFVVVGVHVFLAPVEGYKPFGGTLIHGLSPSSSREDVRRNLGMPNASGGGERGIFNRWIDHWDRFDLINYSLMVVYRSNGIKLLTLMTPTEAKRLA